MSRPPNHMTYVDYLTWCQVLRGFWMTKHLYLTTMLLTSHRKGPGKVNVNIVYFLQTTPEYHIWWVTSPCSQNSKDICFLNVRIILWEPDGKQLMWDSEKKQIVACELGYKKEASMSVRPRPTVAAIEASRQITSILSLTSNGRETPQ